MSPAPDVVFTSYDGTTKLSHEIISWDGTTLLAWVKCTHDVDADQDFYMYTGCSTCAEQSNRTGTWPATFKAMWHMGGTGVLVSDSTANAHTGTKKAVGEPADGTGKVGQGQVFDGSDDYIGYGDSDDFSFGNATADSPFTVHAWIRIDDFTNLQYILAKWSTDASLWEWALFASSAKLYFTINDDSTTVRRGRYYNSALSTETWYHVVVTYSGNGDSTGINIYIDGVDRDDSDYNNGEYVAMHNTAQPVEIGRLMSTTDRYLDGIVDEAAIIAEEWASTTVTTAFNSQNKPLVGESGGFWKIGAAEGTLRSHPACIFQDPGII
jgi:hypothetical protein